MRSNSRGSLMKRVSLMLVRRLKRLAMLLALVPMTMSAQAYLVGPGSRVRVMKTSQRYEPRRTGVIASIGRDSALVRLDLSPESTATFALARLERFDGTRTREREGVVKGAVVGGGIAFLLATAVSRSYCGDSMFCFERKATRVTLTPIGALIGMAIGRTRGARHTVDKWTPLIKPSGAEYEPRSAPPTPPGPGIGPKP
jgi:hypothetical protein